MMGWLLWLDIKRVSEAFGAFGILYGRGDGEFHIELSGLSHV
jgi:hypothetical protein